MKGKSILFAVVLTVACAATGLSACKDHECSHFARYQIIQEATCMEEGFAGDVCEVCGEIVGEMEVIPALPHDYGQDGICTVCGTPITPTKAELLTFRELPDGTYSVAAKADAVLMGELCIGAEYDGKQVSAIAENGFREIQTISGVFLAEGIRSIGDHAFYNCADLLSVRLPEGFLSIGEYAFQFDYALTAIELPDSLQEMRAGAFAQCGLKEITIPGSLAQLPERALMSCTDLKTARLEEGVLSIGENAFGGCRSLEMFSAAEGLRTIGPDAFAEALSLTSVTLPDSVQEIGTRAFYVCNFSSFRIPAGITTIEAGVFMGTKLTSISVPAGVTAIGKEAFSGCPFLEEIHLPEGLTRIGEYAFFRCPAETIVLPDTLETIEMFSFAESSIAYLTIPASVTHIERLAFASCQLLNSIYFEDPSGWEGIDANKLSDPQQAAQELRNCVTDLIK